MVTGRAERAGVVVAVLWYVVWIAGLVASTAEMTTWPFRLVTGATAAYVAYRLARFLNGRRSLRV